MNLCITPYHDAQTRGHNMSRSIPKTNIGMKIQKNIHLIYDMVKMKMEDNMLIL